MQGLEPVIEETQESIDTLRKYIKEVPLAQALIWKSSVSATRRLGEN